MRRKNVEYKGPAAHGVSKPTELPPLPPNVSAGFAENYPEQHPLTRRRPRIVMLPPGVTLEQAQRMLDATEPEGNQ